MTGIAIAPTTARPGESATSRRPCSTPHPCRSPSVPVRLHLEAGGQRPRPRADDRPGRRRDGDRRVRARRAARGLWRGHVEVVDRRRSAVRRPPLPGALGRACRARAARGWRPGPDSVSSRRPTSSRPRCGWRRRASVMPSRRSTRGRSRSLGGTSLPDLEKTEAVVLANVDDLGASDAQRAGRVRRATGAVCWSSPATASTARGPHARRRRGWASARSSGQRRPRSSLAARSMGAEHPVFRPSPTPSTATSAGRRSPRSRGSSPTRHPRPGLVPRRRARRCWSGRKGRGKVLWFTSACDRAWGDWPRGRMYLPMVHQMIAYVPGLAEGGRVRQERRRRRAEPGRHRVRAASSTSSTPTRSSRRRRAARRTEFADRFGFRLPEPSRSPRRQPGRRRTRRRSAARDEIWPWLALTLVGLLLVENFLANRTAA